MRSKRLLVVVAKVILAATVFLEGCQSHYLTTRGDATGLLTDQINPLLRSNTIKTSFSEKRESYQWLDSMVVSLQDHAAPRAPLYSSHELASVESVHLY